MDCTDPKVCSEIQKEEPVMGSLVDSLAFFHVNTRFMSIFLKPSTWHLNFAALVARSSTAAVSRIAPCCLMLISSIRRSLHAVIYIHEPSETALCAARAPPRRRVRSRARKTRLQNKASRSSKSPYPSRGRDTRPVGRRRIKRGARARRRASAR